MSQSQLAYTIADEFLPEYGYKSEITTALNNGGLLEVSTADLARWDDELADSVVDNPKTGHETFNEAIQAASPVELNGNVEVAFTDLLSSHTRQIHELSSDDSGHLRTVSGTIEQITSVYEKPLTIAYECERCELITEVKQPEYGAIQDPHQCVHCERKGPFHEDERQSEYVDEVRLQFKQPASDSPNQSGDEITAIARGPLLHIDGLHIQAYAGAKAEITGTIKRREGPIDGTKERFIIADHVRITDPLRNQVDIETHTDTFTELANRSDAFGLWCESLAPQLHDVAKWPVVKQLAVAWLFGSPKWEYDGTIYRGDIHAGVISDPGMAKSLFCRELRQYSPKCLHRSATGISSDVGLTAAAVQDASFGSGQPTLKPGILPRANGGHAIIEEIDKGPEDLEGMNDGLEGEQRITVDKWGINADLETRVGLFVTGNPVDGRFDPYGPPAAEQVDIDHSLLSRFDGLITMSDKPDPEADKKLAETMGRSWKETAEAHTGKRDELEQLARPIDPDVGRAWVAYAREHVHPIPSDAALETLGTWFAEDVRDFNDEDSPLVPVTPRKFETGVRIATAYARLYLSDTVTKEHAEQAIAVCQALAGENIDPNTGQMDSTRTDGSRNRTQQQAIDGLKAIIRREEELTHDELVETSNLPTEKTESYIQKLKDQREIYEPESGVYRLV